MQAQMVGGIRAWPRFQAKESGFYLDQSGAEGIRVVSTALVSAGDRAGGTFRTDEKLSRHPLVHNFGPASLRLQGGDIASGIGSNAQEGRER